MNDNIWAENIILADADYVDSVAFSLTVNFERMLERRIPPADMARWLECVALDGGLRPVSHDAQPSASSPTPIRVLLVHNHQTTALRNFAPANLNGELHQQAFQGPLGEFAITAMPTTDIAGKDQLLSDALQHVATLSGLRKLMLVVPDSAVDALRPTLRHIDTNSPDLRTTLFTMQPQTGPFRHQLLGYSLMAALGIGGQEIEEKLGNRELSNNQKISW